VNINAAAAALGVLLVTMVASSPMPTPAFQEQERYADVTAWCDGRFPYRDDLQEACKWGAYEMTGTSNK
jgi:hypothetical protein